MWVCTVETAFGYKFAAEMDLSNGLAGINCSRVPADEVMGLPKLTNKALLEAFKFAKDFIFP